MLCSWLPSNPRRVRGHRPLTGSSRAVSACPLSHLAKCRAVVSSPGTGCRPHMPPQLRRALTCHVIGDSCGQVHPEVLPWHCLHSRVCPAACCGPRAQAPHRPSWFSSWASGGWGSRISVSNSCFCIAHQESLSSGPTGAHLPPDPVAWALWGQGKQLSGPKVLWPLGEQGLWLTPAPALTPLPHTQSP